MRRTVRVEEGGPKVPLSPKQTNEITARLDDYIAGLPEPTRRVVVAEAAHELIGRWDEQYYDQYAIPNTFVDFGIPKPPIDPQRLRGEMDAIIGRDPDATRDLLAILSELPAHIAARTAIGAAYTVAAQKRIRPPPSRKKASHRRQDRHRNKSGL